MRIKRFVAANMRDALNQVRLELGDAAVIMSSKQLDHGVEVTAAIDESSSVKEASSAAITQSWQEQHVDVASRPWRPAQAPDVSSNDIASMYHELKNMRAMLEQQLSGFAWQQTTTQQPAKVTLLKRLTGMGLGWDLANMLLEELSSTGDQESDWRQCQANILSRVPVLHDALLENGGVLALIGPTGVGKTTTIAKLAARYALRYGTQDCALVTLDTYKIGAQEQLKIFADLIGLPLFTASTPGEFFRLLERLSAKKMVLVDTAGLSQRDARLQAYLADSLDDGTGSIQPLLVMSSATQLSVMREIYLAFGQLKPVGCILTKLDEATLLGPALTLLAEYRLPLAYCANGQRVPEDLLPITARELLDQAIAMGRVHGEHALAGAQFGLGREMTDV